MPQFKTEERAQLTAVAVEMRARGATYDTIAEEIAVNRKTVMRWLDAEYARRSEHRSVSDAREQSIARYDMLFKECMERLDTLGKGSRSMNASSYINSARSCQERIDKLTGAEAPIKYQEVEDQIIVEWEDLDSPEALLELEAGEPEEENP